MVVLIFYLFVESSALTYHEPIDSLRKAVTTPVGVQEKAELYNALAWEYRDTHPDSALYFTKQALRLARENKLRRQEVQALNYMGVAYRNLSVYSKAFEMYLEALRLSEQYQDDEQRGYTLINLGNLYIFQTNFQGAIQYFVKALDQAQALGDRRMQAYCNINLARSYEGIGEYGRAEIYMRSVIDIREGLSDEYGLMGAEIELAEILRKTGNFRASQEITERILNDDKLKDYPRILILAYNTLSKIYLGQGKTQKAQQYAELALDLSREYASRYDEKEVLRNLSKIYASKDDFRPAFEYHINFSELNQLLFSEENIRKIEQLKNQYEAEKQEAENEFLRRQDELNRQVIERQQMIIGLSIVAVLLLVIVATLSYRAFLVRTRLSEEIKRQKDKIVQDRDTIEIQSAKLIELDAAKSRFFSNISHDLRSPLSLILGNLEMIQDDEASYLTPNSRKNLDIGLKNSKRLLYLTDEINDITRLEEGRLNLKLENIRVNTFLTLLTDMFKSTAEYKAVGLGFETSLPASQTFRVDARQFEKVFYNLISNAIRHTRKGDIIRVRADKQGDFVRLSFRDTGEGISQESLPHIFDRFYQSHDKEYKTREGLGIGLALVKELVELHQGSITVESTLGEGAEFRVLLPQGRGSHPMDVAQSSFIKEHQKIDRDIVAESRAHVTLMSGTGDRPVLLLVDDHPEIRYYIRQILEDSYVIREAAHGLEALDLLKQEKTDLIITDLMMPWMDGFELIEAIQSSEEFRKIPVLVVSARISGEDKERVLYQGVNDYLLKPFSKKELVLRVENLLKQKEIYSENQPNVFDSLMKENFHVVEKDILLKLENVVRENISDPGLSVYMLGDAMAASERQVYRLVKKLTGLTPYEYITEVRLQYADYLIRKNKVKNPSEAARSIGIQNVTLFKKQYEKKFGITPGELLKN